jgi:hypothetical protein
MPNYQDCFEPTLTDQDLCAYFDITAYLVDDLPPPHNPADLGKYAVTTLAHMFSAEVVNKIPLAATQVEAESLAVTHLKLRQLYIS